MTLKVPSSSSLGSSANVQKWIWASVSHNIYIKAVAYLREVQTLRSVTLFLIHCLTKKKR